VAPHAPLVTDIDADGFDPREIGITDRVAGHGGLGDSLEADAVAPTPVNRVAHDGNALRAQDCDTVLGLLRRDAAEDVAVDDDVGDTVEEDSVAVHGVADDVADDRHRRLRPATGALEHEYRGAVDRIHAIDGVAGHRGRRPQGTGNRGIHRDALGRV